MGCRMIRDMIQTTGTIYQSNGSALPSASNSLLVLPTGPLIQTKQDGCRVEHTHYLFFILYQLILIKL